MNVLSKIQVKSPVAIKWKINESRLKQLRENPEDGLCTDIFKASNLDGIEYALEINLNNPDHPGKAWIGLGFSVEDEIQKITADFELSIPSANEKEKLHKIFTDFSFGHGTLFCDVEGLLDPENGYIVDGELIIKMEGILTIEKDDPLDIQAEIIDERDQICIGLWNQEDKDFVFIVDGKEIKAHKWILALRSPVFQKMLGTDWKESKDGKVKIEDFDFDVVEKALKLCYHKSLVSDLSLEAKIEVFRFFDKYEVKPMKEQLEEVLISLMDESNVCVLANCSLVCNALKLDKKCFDFLNERRAKNLPVADLDLLDKDFAFKLFKESFYHISQ